MLSLSLPLSLSLSLSLSHVCQPLLVLHSVMFRKIKFPLWLIFSISVNNLPYFHWRMINLNVQLPLYLFTLQVGMRKMKTVLILFICAAFVTLCKTEATSDTTKVHVRHLPGKVHRLYSLYMRNILRRFQKKKYLRKVNKPHKLMQHFLFVRF